MAHVHGQMAESGYGLFNGKSKIGFVASKMQDNCVLKQDKIS
jgi:hypothetical protein